MSAAEWATKAAWKRFHILVGVQDLPGESFTLCGRYFANFLLTHCDPSVEFSLHPMVDQCCKICLRLSGTKVYPVEGFLLMQEPFRLHQEAIHNRDWDAVEFTHEQLYTTVFTAFAQAVERMQEHANGQQPYAGAY